MKDFIIAAQHSPRRGWQSHGFKRQNQKQNNIKKQTSIMKKQTIDFGTSTTYKAPKCKVVALSLSAACLQVTSPTTGSTIEDVDEEEYGEY